MTRERHVFQNLNMKDGELVGFRGIHKGKIIRSNTKRNYSIPSVDNINVFLVEKLMHNILSISQLSDIDFDVFFNQMSYKADSRIYGFVLFSGTSGNNIYKIKLSNLQKQ